MATGQAVEMPPEAMRSGTSWNCRIEPIRKAWPGPFRVAARSSAGTRPAGPCHRAKRTISVAGIQVSARARRQCRHSPWRNRRAASRCADWPAASRRAVGQTFVRSEGQTPGVRQRAVVAVAEPGHIGISNDMRDRSARTIQEATLERDRPPSVFSIRGSSGRAAGR